MNTVDRRRILPTSLTGVAGVVCAACCVVPVLIVAGVLGGAGWVAFGTWLPAVALVLVAIAAGSWWIALRKQHGKECDESCDCRNAG